MLQCKLVMSARGSRVVEFINTTRLAIFQQMQYICFTTMNLWAIILLGIIQFATIKIARKDGIYTT